MRRDSLLRSTSFRLAVIFALVFSGVFAATGFALYELIKWQLLQRQDETIQETYAVIANAYGDRDLTDLLETVQTNVRATRDHERIFLVLGADGRVLGGNVRKQPFADGWSDIPARRLGLDDDLHYRAFAGDVEGNRLIVGSSSQGIDSLQETVWEAIGWGSVVVALLSIIGGWWIALRVQRRFDAVRDTLDHISHGDLAARIPLLGKGDDIDDLSRDLNMALTRLETTIEGMRQVSNDIAHDLKTPLNRLKMSIEEALAKQERGEAVPGELAEAASEADQINKTFEALLRIAQIESGARKARFARLDIADIVNGLGEIYVGVAEDREQTLVVKSQAAANPSILGDRELITQMLANLIENAIRHGPAGTMIHLGVTNENGTVTVRIADNGPGIPVAERAKVFRRLYRLEKSRSSPGSGLGLALVKAVADLHDAELRLGDAGPGLRVEIAFPAV